MNNANINGTKIIILSKLRFGDMTSAEMLEYLDDVGYPISRTRVHQNIKHLETSGFITTKETTREVKRRSSSKGNRQVMSCKISKAGCNVITAYLETEIGATIEDIRERVASTLNDKDKEMLKINLNKLMETLSELVADCMGVGHSTDQGKMVANLDKQQLIAVEKCCIESLKWIDGN